MNQRDFELFQLVVQVVDPWMNYLLLDHSLHQRVVIPFQDKLLHEGMKLSMLQRHQDYLQKVQVVCNLCKYSGQTFIDKKCKAQTLLYRIKLITTFHQDKKVQIYVVVT
jgi:hypothetical protein